MKTIFLVLLFNFVTSANSSDSNKANEILQKFNEVSLGIEKLEYDIQLVDTFSANKFRVVNGHAFIQRNSKDNKFGYYFVGECYEYNSKGIYDGSTNFKINTLENSFKIVKSLKGHPGQQLVNRITELLFSFDNDFDKVIISNESDSEYTLELLYDDDPNIMITNFKKIIVLNKQTFLPVEFTMQGLKFGERYSHKFIIQNMKMNKEVIMSLESEKMKLSSLKMLEPEVIKERISLVGSVAKRLLLPELSASNSMSEIITNKITLIDFWEVYCGACIASMPKTNKLAVKYEENINVIGIVSDNSEYAKQIIDKQKISFQNFIGNKFVKESFAVKAFPSYFLIDKKGIIRKEYIGYSKSIENDIIDLINEK